ncbi:MAG: hypothetical protein JXB46_00220 [Candidatus Eisenbacteria bacterium]|nr:hypothetical protein [Candidatus Eisenbacteria bacterium]
MRRVVPAVVLALAFVSLLALGSSVTTVKVYFTVGPRGDTSALQLWRCNRDGSEPELIAENGQRIGGVAVDSENELLFFARGGSLVAADLDGVEIATWGTTPSFLMVNIGDGVGSVAAVGGYVCWQVEGPYVASSMTDGSDLVYFDCSGFPGIVPNPVAVGVALHVSDDNPVEATTWGRIKASFRP